RRRSSPIATPSSAPWASSKTRSDGHGVEMNPLVPSFIENLAPYIPGKPIEETEREYGVQNIVKLASNENPLGPSPKAVEAMSRALGQMHLYPDASVFYLRNELAAFLDVRPEEL